MIGVEPVFVGGAARRPYGRADLAKHNFSILTILIAVGLTLFLSLPIVTHWNGAGDGFRMIVAGLPPDAVLMSNNPPGVWVATRHPGIPLVVGPVPNLLAAADHYSVRYLLLDINHTADLDPLYQTGVGDRLKLIKTVGAWKVFEVTP